MVVVESRRGRSVHAGSGISVLISVSGVDLPDYIGFAWM